MTSNLSPKIVDWLEAKCGPTDTVSKLFGGRNNLLWLLQSHNGSKYVIKDYGFDGDDRLNREWSFLSRLSHSGIKGVPRPIFCDKEGRIALFSYLPGRKLSGLSISSDNITDASFFISEVARVDAEGMPEARDSHSSLEGHVRSINDRVNALESVARVSPEKKELKYFVTNELRPFWENTKRKYLKNSFICYWDSMKYFLSPSDFGFHNILCSQGSLSFLDFEYAGQDDLAKLLSDFCLCPQVKVKKDYAEMFCKNIINNLELDESFNKRLQILTALGRTKWLCIVLNIFLPDKTERISTATGSRRESIESIKLQLARDLLSVSKTEEMAA